MINNAHIWLTPVWLLSLGVTAGTIVLLFLYGILWLVSRSTADATLRLVKESILQWISYAVAVFVVVAVLGTYFMPWRQIQHSLARLPRVGTQGQTIEVPAHTDDLEVPVDFLADELQEYTFTSDHDLVIGVEPGKAYSKPLINVEGNVPYSWNPTSKHQRSFEGHVTKLFLTNVGDELASLTIQTRTDVPYPQVRQIPIAAAAVIGVYLVYLLVHLLFPHISIIALATSKEAVAQPLYVLALLIGAFLLTLYIIIPYNTFGEDVKMYKDSGMMTIMVLAIIVALWTASVSVADEIEGRTALTLLSKPVSRRQFVLGKFLGIVWSIFLMFVVLGAWMLICVSLKVVYDARETSNPDRAGSCAAQK